MILLSVIFLLALYIYLAYRRPGISIFTSLFISPIIFWYLFHADYLLEATIALTIFPVVLIVAITTFSTLAKTGAIPQRPLEIPWVTTLGSLGKCFVFLLAGITIGIVILFGFGSIYGLFFFVFYIN